MRYDNACDIVAGSALVAALRSKYGRQWHEMSWVRILLAGFIGALQGAKDPDHILDEMRATAEFIGRADAR